MIWKEITDPFEEIPGLRHVTNSDLMAAWNLMEFQDQPNLKTPYIGWSEIDDLDKIEFIMNLEKIKSISINDNVSDFLMKNGVDCFQIHFRDEKINSIFK